MKLKGNGRKLTQYWMIKTRLQRPDMNDRRELTDDPRQSFQRKGNPVLKGFKGLPW